MARKTTQKTCKSSQTASPVEREKTDQDQDSFRKRQLNRKKNVATSKRNHSAVTDLVDSELYTDAGKAASRHERTSDVVALQTNSPSSSLAHKRFSRDDYSWQEQNDNYHRKKKGSG